MKIKMLISMQKPTYILATREKNNERGYFIDEASLVTSSSNTLILMFVWLTRCSMKAFENSFRSSLPFLPTIASML
eukprot:m.24911 g.24911  ORF g.24911 m.24911 type:complete len:76 (+) comp5708_c1_seq1:304-531(+)